MKATRAKKGGQLGINGEFYNGGTFLPSTRLPKQGPAPTEKRVFKARKLNDWQLKNLLNAIAGTKKTISEFTGDTSQLKAQLANFEKQLSEVEK